MGVQGMSAVYEDVKKMAMRRQARDFTTMQGKPVDPIAGTIPEYSSSSLGQYIGSAFVTSAVVIYASHGEPSEIGDRAKIVSVRSGQIFPLPLKWQTDTSTMSLGSAWVASEPEVCNSGVVNLQWPRKVIFSGKLQFKTAQLPRRAPRTIVGAFLADEGNG